MTRVMIIAAAAVMLLWYLKEKIAAYSITAVLIKTLVSAFVIMLAVFNAFAGSGEDGFAAFVIMGLVFGLLGDVWLDLKYVYRNDDRIYTYAGFGVFAVGHVFYIAGMLRYHAGAPVFILVPFVLALIIGIANGFMGKLMKLEYGSYRPVVMAYGVLLFAMLLLAVSLAAENGFGVMRLNLFALGGISFAISDLILSGTYFGEGKERPVDLITNYIFYYLAQFLIAMSLL